MESIRKCRACKTEFTPRVRTQKYCSNRCANRASQARLRARAKIGKKAA